MIGNAAYGLKSDYNLLQSMALRIAALSGKELKLGAEGLVNGRKAIDLAAETGSIAYILHTSSTAPLLSYALDKHVPSMVYTLCRVGETRAIAAADLMRIKGTSYFERRRFLREEILERLGEFSLFGSGDAITSQVRSLISSGASKVVLYPVFQNMKDMISQMNMISDWIG